MAHTRPTTRILIRNLLLFSYLLHSHYTAGYSQLQQQLQDNGLFTHTNSHSLPKEHIEMVFSQEIIHSKVVDEYIESERHERKLKRGDFDELNELFKATQFKLPDAEFDINVLGFKKMFLEDILCFNMQVEDVKIFNNKNAHRSEFDANIDVSGMGLDCSFQWQLGEKGKAKGRGQINSSGNSIESKMRIWSEEVDNHTPTHISLENCFSIIDVRDISFQGGFIALMANALVPRIKKTLETEMKESSCRLFENFVSEELRQKLSGFSKVIQQYLTDISDEEADPLLGQKLLDMNNGNASIIDFLDTRNTLRKIPKKLIERIGSYLSSQSNYEDDEGLTTQDFGANILIRDLLLNPDRSFTLNSETLNTTKEYLAILYDGEDILARTTVSVTAMHIVGLDSISQIQPFEFLESQTIQTSMNWTSIVLEMDVTIEMRPSTIDDLVIVDSNAAHQIEHVQLRMEISDLKVAFAILIAIDESKLGGVELAAFTEFPQLLPCALSTSHAINITHLEIRMGDVTHPTLTGFISPGIDRVFSSVSKIFTDMYENVLLHALPKYFMTTGREQLNDLIQNYISVTISDKPCATYQKESTNKYMNLNHVFSSVHNMSFVDNNDSGRQYGEIPNLIQTVMNNQLLSTDENGLSIINEKLIEPMTLSQSNESGVLVFPGKKHNISIPPLIKRFGIDNVSLVYEDIRFENLDNIGHPLQIFHPTESNPYLLSNHITISSRERPLRAVTKGTFSFDKNEDRVITELEISLEVIEKIDLYSSLLLQVDDDGLMTLPFQDLIKPSFWFTSIPTEMERNLQKTVFADFRFMGLDISPANNIALHVSCVSCESSIGRTVSSVIDAFKSSGTLDFFVQQSVGYLSDVISDIQLQDVLGRLLCKIGSKLNQTASNDLNICQSQSKPLVPTGNTQSSAEFLLLSFGIVAQAAFLSVNTFFQGWDVSDNNPYWGENSLPRNDGFANLENIIKDDSYFVNIARKHLSGSKNIYDINTLEPGINPIIRNILLDHDATYTKSLNHTQKSFAGFDFELHSVRVQGIDSFFIFDVFNVIGPHTFHNQFELKELSLEFNLTVAQKSPRHMLIKDDFVSQGWAEYMTVALDLYDLNLEAALLLAVDEEELAGVRLGSLLNSSNIFPCIMSTVFSILVTQLKIEIGEIDKLEIKGFLHGDTKDVLFSYADKILDLSGINLREAISTLLETISLKEFNEVLEAYFQNDEKASCAQYNTMLVEEFIDFRYLFLGTEDVKGINEDGSLMYGDFFIKAMDFFDRIVISPGKDGAPKINSDIISPLTKSKSGTAGVLFYNHTYNMLGIKVPGIEERVDMLVSDIRVENLDSFGYPMKIFVPHNENGNILNSEITFGSNGKHLRIAAKVFMDIDEGTGHKVRNEVDTIIEIHDIKIKSTILAMVRTNAFTELQIKDMRNPFCWLATMSPPRLRDKRSERSEIRDLQLTFEDFHLKMDCVTCESPDVEKLGKLSSMIISKRAVSSVIHKILDSGLIQRHFDEFSIGAEHKCSNRRNSETEPLLPQNSGPPVSSRVPLFIGTSSKGVISFFVGTASAVVLLSAVFFTIRRISQKNHEKWLLSLPKDELIRRFDEHEAVAIKQRSSDMSLKPMCMSANIPRIIRILIPVGILMNILLFISSHLSNFAAVDLNIQIDLLHNSVTRIFEFSVLKLAFGMWSSGSKFLAMIVFFFAILWPYIKQITMLILWLIAPSKMGLSRQGYIFQLLEAIGKWQMIDTFVFVISFGILRLSFTSMDEYKLFPDLFYDIELAIVPLWGLYANFMGQIFSQIILRAVISYHQEITVNSKKEVNSKVYHPIKSLEEDSPAFPFEPSFDVENCSPDEVSQDSLAKLELSDIDSKVCKTLRQHIFKFRWQKKEESLKVRRGVDILIGFACMFVIGLIYLGTCLPSFSVGLLGVLGIAIEAGENFEHRAPLYSLFDILGFILVEGRFLNSPGMFFGLISIATFFLTTLVITPCLQAGSIFFLWFLPSISSSKIRLKKMIHAFQAWQYGEVYVFAIFMTTWQLGGVLKFMLGPYCQSLDSTFSSLVNMGFLSEADECFYGETSMHSAVYCLFLASGILRWLRHFVTLAASQQIRDDSLVESGVKEDLLSEEKESVNFEIDTRDTKNMIDHLLSIPVCFTDCYTIFLEKCGDDDLGKSQKSSNC